MKKQYNELIQHIHPTQEQRERMLDAVLDERTSTAKPRRRILPYGIAAAAAVTLLVPTTVYAEEIKTYVYDLFEKEEKVPEYVYEDVLHSVFSDTDGHVQVLVTELISDSISTYGVIEYRALDDEGAHLLTELSEPRLSPDMKNEDHVYYGVSFGSGAMELKEHSTATTRVFRVAMDTASDGYGTESVLLRYVLSDGKIKETAISISESMEFSEVRIDSGKAPKKDYLPTGYKISPLTVMVYGEDIAMAEWSYIDGVFSEKVISDDELDSLYLVMKDGAEYDLLQLMGERRLLESWGSMSTVRNPECHYDLSIYQGTFYEPIDITQVAGLEIDGVYYPIEE